MGGTEDKGVGVTGSESEGVDVRGSEDTNAYHSKMYRFHDIFLYILYIYDFSVSK